MAYSPRNSYVIMVQKGGNVMVHIAIVDDEPKQSEQLQSYLDRYREERGVEMKVTCFYDAEAFLQGYQPDLDLIFMDIQLPDRDGMTLSKKLRETNHTVILIFVTNMVQMAVEGYSVDAMDFIVKPVSYYRLAASLDKARQKLAQNQGVILTIRTKSGIYCIDSNRLRYVETQVHHTIYHTTDGLYDAVGSLKKLEEQLAGESFARCNNGYLVNLRYVRAVNDETVLVGEDALRISRTRRKDFLRQLSDYLGRGG